MAVKHLTVVFPTAIKSKEEEEEFCTGDSLVLITKVNSTEKWIKNCHKHHIKVSLLSASDISLYYSRFISLIHYILSVNINTINGVVTHVKVNEVHLQDYNDIEL